MRVDERYFHGWLAALDEMRRPDWREVYAQTTRDIAARRGRSLAIVTKELGLAGAREPAHNQPTRRVAPRRRARNR